MICLSWALPWAVDEQLANQPTQPGHPSTLVVPSRRPPPTRRRGPWDGDQEYTGRGGMQVRAAGSGTSGGVHVIDRR